MITTEIRNKIIDRWALLTPLVPRINLQAHVYQMEKKYWENLPPWSPRQLTNKITNNSIAIAEEVMESNESITKKARAINDLNKTIAQVNKLVDQSLAATFIITTNVNEASLAADMNVVDAELLEQDDDENI